jgi:hypothetical protein
VNFGRLGFLAAFDAHNLLQHAAIIFGPDPPITEHMMLAAAVYDAEGEARHSGLAINDCVITAGSPFRMIELRVSIDDAEGPSLSGDGDRLHPGRLHGLQRLRRRPHRGPQPRGDGGHAAGRAQPGVPAVRRVPRVHASH